MSCGVYNNKRRDDVIYKRREEVIHIRGEKRLYIRGEKGQLCIAREQARSVGVQAERRDNYSEFTW